MKLKMARLAAACAVVIAGSLAWAAPASAGVDQTGCTDFGCYTADGWGSGFGYWQSDGDKMHVCDQYADGWSIVVVATINSQLAPNKWHTAGADKCTERSYGNLPEGKEFSYIVCLAHYGEPIQREYCGPRVYPQA